MIERIIIAMGLTIAIVCGIMAIFSMFMIIKNRNTFKNHCIIVNAIHNYQMYLIKNHLYNDINKVDFNDMEEYEKTLNRFWDWGYTRILPKEKFELIKSYINPELLN